MRGLQVVVVSMGSIKAQRLVLGLRNRLTQPTPSPPTPPRKEEGSPRSTFRQRA